MVEAYRVTSSLVERPNYFQRISGFTVSLIPVDFANRV